MDARQRTLLEPLSEADRALYTRLYCDPEAMRNVMPPLSAGEATAGFEATLAACRARRQYVWTIASPGSTGPFGLIGLVVAAREAEVGVILPGARQGQGHATRAIGQVATLAFDSLRLEALWTRHAEGHGLAAGLMSRLGFERQPDARPPHAVRWRLQASAWPGPRADKPLPIG